VNIKMIWCKIKIMMEAGIHIGMNLIPVQQMRVVLLPYNKEAKKTPMVK